MNIPCPLSLLQTFVIILSIAASQHKVESKTTLSKLQYINAIRDVIEGLIKSLATRQKIETNRRLELHDYRKHHEHRLGRDILVCRLCKEIFVDPDKYFDHAHFHVVEKLKLMQTTGSNLRCQLCEDSFHNQFELYKHCYETHLLQNLDRLTTKPLETTTTKPHYAEELYCKICNITLMYPERFYHHSFQHLLDNMDLIMNTTMKFNTKDDDGREKYDHTVPREHTTHIDKFTRFVRNKSNGYRSSRIFSEVGIRNISLNRTRIFQYYNQSSYNRNLTKLRVSNKTYNTSFAFKRPFSNRTKYLNMSGYTRKQTLKFNKTKRFYNVTNENLKGLILKDLHKTNIAMVGSRNMSKQTRVMFEPEMVQHIKKAALWVQQKERKRDPETELLVVARLNKKAYMRHLLTNQQRKLVSLERYLDRNSSDIYRYVVVNDTIVDRTSPEERILPTLRSSFTLPLCFITEPIRQSYSPRGIKYTNYTYKRNFSQYRRFSNYSSYILKRNLYKNFNNSYKNYRNNLKGTNLNTIQKHTAREFYYQQNPHKKLNYSNDNTKITYYNKNLYQNMPMPNNVSQIEWSVLNTKTLRYYTKKFYFNRNLYKYLNATSQFGNTVKNSSDRFITTREYNQNSIVTMKRKKRNMIHDILENVAVEDVLDAYHRQNILKRNKRQVNINKSHPATDQVDLTRDKTPQTPNSNMFEKRHIEKDFKDSLLNETTTGWTNLYYTASKMIEKFFQTQIRVVRITKDLRTTKKVTLEPYAGAEEFTGDSFQGDSGENRYERILKKMRSTQVYLKCPFCPLRFFYNPERMSHINMYHNMSGYLSNNDTTFDVLFKTFPPHKTQLWNQSFDDFVENFQTFDYEYVTRAPPTQSTQTAFTTIDLAAFSKVMENFMKPDYLKGFLTTAGSTRNIDYLHRARTYATTMPHLSQVEESLKNARNYLRQLAATMLDSDEYKEIATTVDTIGTSIRKEVTDRKVDAKVEDIKRNDESTRQGVVIEEVTTQQTTLGKKEVLQMGMKVLEEQLQFVKNKELRSTIIHTLESTTHNRSIRTERYTERFRIFKEKPIELNQILKLLQSSMFASTTKSLNNMKDESTLRMLDESSRKLTTTNDTRLGPTEMSYEDSDNNKRNATATMPLKDKLYTENFANFIASLKSLKTSLSTHGLTTPVQSDHAKFLRKLADLKAEERRAVEEEKRRREKAKADYDEQLKRAEAKIDEKNTPLFINVNDMMKYRCEDEERNKRVADTFKFILKNDVREAVWNATKNQINVTETYDDGYGDLDYETMTQYVYDPTDHRVFKNMPPTRTSKFVTHRPTMTREVKSTAPPNRPLF